MSALYRNIVVVAGLACALAGCSSERESSGTAAGAAPKQAASITATRVEVAAIGASQPVLEMVRPGEVEGAREAHLAAALGGFVEAVKVRSGDSVKRGQVIAYVDTSTHNAQAKLTRIEVEDAERELARLQSLGKSVASARVDAARAQLDRAKAQHALSRTRQDRAVIRAPFAGVIVDLSIERGEVVAPGAPIARLIQLDPVHVTVSVADRDIASLQEGSAAKVTAAGSSQPITGTVRRLQPAADLQTRTFMIEVEVDNPASKLLPGMIAQVAFASKGSADAILLPQDLLVTRRDGNGVFLLGKDETAVWRPLTLGAIIGTEVEVKDGLTVGDKVVSQGQRSLSQGDHLLVTREGHCCTEGRIVYQNSAASHKAEAPSAERSPPPVSVIDSGKQGAQAGDAPGKAGQTP